MKKLFLFVMIVPSLGFSQLPVIQSKMYSWKTPGNKANDNVTSAVLFEGSCHDMEYLQMSANVIMEKVKINARVPDHEEHLLIVKSGMLTIGFKDSTWSIGGGSVVLLMPGEQYVLQNNLPGTCAFYRMAYRSKLPIDIARGKASGGSFVRDWSKIQFSR